MSAIGSTSSSSSSHMARPELEHPDICVITDDLLEAFSSLSIGNVPNIDMDKMLVTCGRTKSLATDGLGAGMVFCARSFNYAGIPILGLWHKSSMSEVSIRDGIEKLKEKMLQKGSDHHFPIEIFAIGGQIPNPEDGTPGNLDEEAEILNLSHDANICGVKFNYSANEDEPLDVVLTPTNIYVSKQPLFERSSAEYVGYPMMFDIHHHPDIQLIVEGNLAQLDEFSFDDIPNVDMDKMLIVSGDGEYLATDSLGACMAICARGETSDQVPVLALWHRTPANEISFIDGIEIMKQKMIESGCDPFNDIEVFVIGGQNPSMNSSSAKTSPQSPSSIISSPTPGNLEDEAEILAIAAEMGIRGVLFNYSKNQREPLEVVLTPTKIFVSKDYNIFQSSPENTEAGEYFFRRSDRDDEKESAITNFRSFQQFYPAKS